MPDYAIGAGGKVGGFAIGAGGKVGGAAIGANVIYRAGAPGPTTPSVLYMVSSRGDALYTLNTTSGVAARVGSADKFGLDEFNPTALTYGGGKLFMGGSGNDALYTVDEATGVAARIASLGFNPSSMAIAGNKIYIIAIIGNTIHRLYSANLDGAGLALIATIPRPDEPQAGEPAVLRALGRGMAYDGSKMYVDGVSVVHSGGLVSNNVLCEINLSNGQLTAIGTAAAYGVQATPTAMTYGDGKIWMTSTNILYTVDPTNGVATRVGAATRFGINLDNPMGLAFKQGTAPAPDPDPDPEPTHLLSETLSAQTLNAVAAGRFGGLTWAFTHSGTTYQITHCFTHGNGLQLRFATAAQAQAFIAAGFTVDSGIAGQQTFLSSVMDYDAARAWAQYRAFPGRYVGGTDYTVTISA